MSPETTPDPPVTELSGQAASTPSIAARDADALASRSASRWISEHERLAAAAALGGVFGIAALAYWWTRAPLYNPSGTVDPWLYTALFVNFDQIYEHFTQTYYASRLPWIVPGRIAYGVLPIDAAYWVLHALAFVSGVVALFVLVRRYLGLAAGVVGAATLALSPMYWNAQYWDYVDGVTLTYLLAALCFGLPLTGGRRRIASLTAAGIFFAAAVTTNMFVLAVVPIYPILYVFVQPTTGLRQRCSSALKDVGALAVGAVALLIALGLHARSNGGQFLFFEPQIDLIRSGTGQYKLPDYEWLRGEPRLLVPTFLVVVAVPLLVLGRRLPPFRFAAGSSGGLAFLTALIYGWEFLAGGNVLELTYYFSYFIVPIALTMASVAALAVSLARSGPGATLGVALAATVAAVIPLGLIFHDERVEWTGRTGMKISVAVLAAAAVLVVGFALARHTSVGTAAGVAAVGAIALACHFAIGSSVGPFAFSTTAPNNRNLYHAALDHVEFVKNSTAREDALPLFWYPAGKRPDLASIQSMYYFTYTYLGVDLPRVTREVRQKLDLSRPHEIVMLCETRACAGGAPALRRAGFPYAEVTARLISRGKIRFWAVLLRRLPNA